MKEILMFTLASCPYCREAHSFIDELKKANPSYSELKITIIDEGKDPATANKYDYYFVPTFYVDGKKLHEGASTKAKIKAVLDAATAG